MLKRLVISAPILGILILAIAACGSETPPSMSVIVPERSSPPPPPPAPVDPATPTPEGGQAAASGEGTQITVDLLDNDGRGPYAYDPADFSFSVGETVTFTLTSEAVYHTFTIDGTPVDLDVDVGETVIYTYTFDEAGTFDLICIPHELNGMVGVITVQ